MRAITDLQTSELVVTVSFFQIGGYATSTQLTELQQQIEELKTRIESVEEDLAARTFG